MLTDDDPSSILIVCLGNVCRSPMAERLLRARLARDGLDDACSVASAGVIGMVGHGMEPEAAAQLVERGGDPEGFHARRLSEAMVDSADLVLTATLDLRRRVLHQSPSALRRTFTLREFAALVSDPSQVAPGVAFGDLVADAARARGTLAGVDLDIVDPIGRGPKVHVKAADLIEAAVDTIGDALSACR